MRLLAVTLPALETDKGLLLHIPTREEDQSNDDDDGGGKARERTYKVRVIRKIVVGLLHAPALPNLPDLACAAAS